MFPKKHASRKYIDLIKQSSSKWANWDPPKRIEVGEYGTVDRETGHFGREGNIYQDETLADIVAQYPPVVAEPLDNYIVNSHHARRRDFKLGAELEVPSIASAALKCQWKFDEERAALLVMHQPRMTYMPDELAKKVFEVSLMKGKSLVTQVFSCRAFAMYLSNKSNETVRLVLQASTSTVVPGISAGGELGPVQWWANGTTGLYQNACSQTESFFPLYTLKSIRPPGLFRRASPVLDSERETLIDTEVPWNYLDEDGEEEEDEEEASEDDVSD